MKRVIRLWLVAFLMLCWENIPLSAQTFLLDSKPEKKAGISFGLREPNFRNSVGQLDYTGRFDVSVNVPITRRLNAEASLAYAQEGLHYGYIAYPGTGTYSRVGSENAVGNLYLGIKSLSHADEWAERVLSVGIYLPTAKSTYESDYAYMVIRYTNPYDYYLFERRTLTLYGNYAVWMRTGEGWPRFHGKIEAGPAFMIPTSGEERKYTVRNYRMYGQGEMIDRDTKTLFHFGLSMGFEIRPVAVMAEFVGVSPALKASDDVDEGFDHFLGFGAALTTWPVRPGLYYQIPLNKTMTKYFLSGILCFKLEVVVP